MSFLINDSNVVDNSLQLSNISSLDTTTRNTFSSILVSENNAVVAKATMVDDSSSIPASPNTGSLVYVRDIRRLQLWTGTQYYNIGITTNTAPTLSGNNASYQLTAENDLVITLTGTDADDDPLVFSATTNSAFDAFASITSNSNVFTISLDDATADASGTVTFHVTDGINTTSSSSTVSFVVQIFYSNYLGTFTEANHTYITPLNGYQQNQDGSASNSLNRGRDVQQYAYHKSNGVSRTLWTRGGSSWTILETDTDGVIDERRILGYDTSAGGWHFAGWDSANDYRKVGMTDYIRTIDAGTQSQLMHADLSGDSVGDNTVNVYSGFPWDSVNAGLDNQNRQATFLTFNPTYKFWAVAVDGTMYGWKYGNASWDPNPNNVTITPITCSSDTPESFRPRLVWLDDETLFMGGGGLNTARAEIWKYTPATSTLAKSHSVNFSVNAPRANYWDFANGVLYGICARNLSDQDRFGVYTLSGSELSNAIAGTTAVSGTYTEINSTNIPPTSWRIAWTNSGFVASGSIDNSTDPSNSCRLHVYFKINSDSSFNAIVKFFNAGAQGFTDNGSTNWGFSGAVMSSGRFLRWRYDASDQTPTGERRIDMYGDNRE